MAGIEAELFGAFGAADGPHFEWQTEHPYVGARERELTRAAFLPLGARVLDLGCAEGATLVHLGCPPGAVGVDVFEDKLAFARARVPNTEFVRASAYELPFEAGRFDHVLVRDVIHHMEQPERALAEVRRVLAPGGRLDVLETCGKNPLIALHALTNAAERGELRSTRRYLERLIGASFQIERVTHHQGLPLHRLVFHPKLGAPSLARRPRVARALAAIERTADALMPAELHAYLHVRATRSGDDTNR